MSKLVFDPQTLCWQSARQNILQLRRQHDQLFDIQMLDPESVSEHAAALGKDLSAFLKHRQAECRLLEPPAAPNWREHLLSLGLPSYQKLLYSRDLTEALSDSLPEPPLDFKLTSLADIGESAFITDLEQAFEGDPENATHDSDWSAEAEFQALKSHAASAFDASTWFRISYQQEPIGMLLPQVYADKPAEGTLFYLGVFKEHRQKSYGKAMHRLGLQLLQARGVRRYLGSTHSNNLSMQAIFKANGCEQIRRLTFLKP